jgi:hypothetical protein
MLLCIVLSACESEPAKTGQVEEEEKSKSESKDKEKESSGKASEATPSGQAGGPPPGAALDCEAETASHSSTECAIEEISCGSIVTARIGEGSSRFSDDFYISKHCGVYQNGYDGPDAVYALDVPANKRAVVFLESPCADLHLAAVKWGDSQSCPTIAHNTGPCEMDQLSETPMVVITSIRPERNLVIVDGVAGSDGVYRLSVQCDDYR